eukprot:gene3440-13496_t
MGQAGRKKAIDFSRLVPGWSSMTPAQQLKERTRLALKQADARSIKRTREELEEEEEEGNKGGPVRKWTRFVFDTSAPLDEEGGRPSMGFLEDRDVDDDDKQAYDRDQGDDADEDNELNAVSFREAHEKSKKKQRDTDHAAAIFGSGDAPSAMILDKGRGTAGGSGTEHERISTHGLGTQHTGLKDHRDHSTHRDNTKEQLSQHAKPTGHKAHRVEAPLCIAPAGSAAAAAAAAEKFPSQAPALRGKAAVVVDDDDDDEDGPVLVGEEEVAEALQRQHYGLGSGRTNGGQSEAEKAAQEAQLAETVAQEVLSSQKTLTWRERALLARANKNK